LINLNTFQEPCSRYQLLVLKWCVQPIGGGIGFIKLFQKLKALSNWI